MLFMCANNVFYRLCTVHLLKARATFFVFFLPSKLAGIYLDKLCNCFCIEIKKLMILSIPKLTLLFISSAFVTNIGSTAIYVGIFAV